LCLDTATIHADAGVSSILYFQTEATSLILGLDCKVTNRTKGLVYTA